MIIVHRNRNLVFPEPGDKLKIVLGDPRNPEPPVEVECIEDPDNTCTSCIFEKECETSNSTQIICLAEERPDNINIKLLPVS